MKKILFILVILLIGCSRSDLTTGKVEFDQAVLNVEIAADQDSRTKGLMFRKSLPKDSGMIFDFEKPGVYRFWMKNTYIPLSIAFLDEEGKVLKIEDMEPLNLQKRYTSPRGTRYAIEANQGWFKRNGVRVGDQAELPAAIASIASLKS